MSWKEDIQKPYVIQTGEGSRFTVAWLNASREISFHTSSFEFPNVSGTLVKRRLQKGRKYNLEIYFQGEDHLKEVESFLSAADDSRAWTIEHPFYGNLLVQPSVLVQDNSQLNISKITGTLLETITNEGIRVGISNVDAIEESAASVSESGAQGFANVPVESSDVAILSEDNTKTLDVYSKAFTENEQIAEINGLYREADNAITSALKEPLAAMQAAQNLINLPAKFENSIESRFNTLKSRLTTLISSAIGLVSIGSKTSFEAQSTSIVSSIAVAVVNPREGDYQSRTDVENVSEDLMDLYDSLLETFDSIEGNGYYPGRETLEGLSNLVNFTVTELFNIALESKQERIFFLEEDSDLISLTHRLYGLDSEDSNIELLKDTNSIGLNEALNIKKGRQIRFYV